MALISLLSPQSNVIAGAPSDSVLLFQLPVRPCEWLYGLIPAVVAEGGFSGTRSRIAATANAISGVIY